jgi:tetratricopeptide (TPR) repeat protein
VEDHPEPVSEIKRLLKVHRAYEHMNAGDVAVEKGDEAAALREYSAAEKLQPENLEMKYWHAVSLVNIGKLDEALPLFKKVFSGDPNWNILTPRLLKNDILKVDAEGLKKILNQ